MINMRCRSEGWWSVRIFKLNDITWKRRTKRILILRSLSSPMSRDKKRSQRSRTCQKQRLCLIKIKLKLNQSYRPIAAYQQKLFMRDVQLLPYVHEVWKYWFDLNLKSNKTSAFDMYNSSFSFF